MLEGLLFLLFTLALGHGNCGMRGMLGERGVWGSPPLYYSCAAYVGGDRNSFINGLGAPPTWRGFMQRMEECVKLIMSPHPTQRVGYANETCGTQKIVRSLDGAYNVCGNCPPKGWPGGPGGIGRDMGILDVRMLIGYYFLHWSGNVNVHGFKGIVL